MASFDFAWQQRLSIATRCLEAAAEREKLLRKIEAMSEPVRMIASNAGLLGEMVLEKVKGQEWGYGFNAKVLEYMNLLEAGVCDPASVNTWALENSASIAGSLLTTEALICVAERPEDEEEYVPEVTGDIGANAANLAW